MLHDNALHYVVETFPRILQSVARLQVHLVTFVVQIKEAGQTSTPVVVGNMHIRVPNGGKKPRL